MDTKSGHRLSKGFNRQTFFDHLDELRDRILKCLFVFLLTSSICYSFIDPLLAHLLKTVKQVIFTSPAEAFLARITISLIVGFIFSIPFTLYETWKFMSVALHEHEQKHLKTYVPASILLFCLGGAFAYFVTIPISIKFLLSFSTDQMQAYITVKNYVSFVGTLILAFGVIFELPLVMMFLTKIGIATPAFLSQKRKHAIVLILIVSAIITPPDVVTQLLLALPLIVLYECGLLISKWTYSKKNVENYVS